MPTALSCRRGIATIITTAVAIIALVTGSSQAAHGGLAGHLYAGTCDDLAGQPVFELETLSLTNPVVGTPSGTPPARVTAAGPPDVYPAVVSTSTVDASMDELLAQPHAITVDIEDEGENIRLACGNVGGVPVEDDLVFGLAPVTTNTTGIAWLHANQDGTTTVRLFVTQGMPTLQDTGTPKGGFATPERRATPAAGMVGTLTATSN